MQPKISIVVPVYNVEIYLRECLDSLINQTLEDIEIICVNDGSTDSSPQILEEYASKDSRIKIFHQENQGVSAARNLGIKNVTSEYLMFVDSDDWIELNALEILYKTIKEKNSDILLFSYFNCRGYLIKKDERLRTIVRIAQDENIKFNDYYKELFDAPLLVCGKLYKTEFIHKNNIFYNLDISCCEDRIFSIEAYINAESISVLDKGFYYYRLNAEQSLSKNSSITLSNTYETIELYKKIIYSSEKIKNKDDIFLASLNNVAKLIIWYFNSIYNIASKKKNIKYIKLIEEKYKPYRKKDEISKAIYKRIKNTIKNYNKLYIRKLIEPIYEVEHRKDRTVYYLFEKQILNIYFGNIKNKLLRFKYFKHVLRLRFLAKFRKIKVAFWYYETEKWSSVKCLYEEFEKSPYFEPIVFLTCPKRPFAHKTQEELMNQNIEFLESQNIKYEKLYDVEENKFLPIKNFKYDIIFYQQPWEINKKQDVLKSADFALTYYVPYCFYSLKTKDNYFRWFHKNLWKYFVETPYHLEEYKKEFGANNCVAIGSAKFDNYKNLNVKKSEKKTVIYAPHHSIEGHNRARTATFTENKNFILELAKKHPEINWIFRPHFALKDRLLKYNAMSQSEIDEYYGEWEKIGTISKSSDNYYEQFLGSDCLITDCMSFLSEYLPTGNPVLHLRCKYQMEEFNDLLKKITDSYYQIYTNEELEQTFNEVIIQGNDYLKDERQANIKLLMIDENKTTSQKIVDYIKQELRIK